METGTSVSPCSEVKAQQSEAKRIAKVQKIFKMQESAFEVGRCRLVDPIKPMLKVP